MPSKTDNAKQLQHLKILAACSSKKMPELASGLEAMGARVLPIPVIETRPIENNHLLDRAISALRAYDWIVFTSAYGVDFFMRRLRESGRESALLPKICTVGPATAATLKPFGCEAALVADQYVGEGVLQALVEYHGGIGHLKGLNVLLPRAEKAREFLPNALSGAGANVEVVPCYRTIRAELDPGTLQKLREERPDLLVFTSSSTINNLVEILGPDFGRKMLNETTVAVIGPITASTAEFFGKRADIIPMKNTIASLLEAIRNYYSRRSPVTSHRKPM